MITESNGNRILQDDLDQLASVAPDLSKLNKKTVLVTGATGLVGSYAVRALAAINRVHNTGMTILAFVRNEQKAKECYGTLLDRGDVRLVVGDILQPVPYDAPVDYIIHCASVTNSKQMVTHPVETIRTAVDGSYQILEFARQKKIDSMVYLSSMEVYGAPDAAKAVTEENDYGYVDVLNVRSCYPEGKRMCECLCASYAHEYDVPVKTARLAQTFGAGVSKSETRVFAQFARSVMQKQDIVLHTTGESTGNYCYTMDSVLGILYILLRGENGQAYNVCNESTTITIRDMAQMTADMSNGDIRVVFDIPKDALTYGYAPPVTMHLSSKKLRQLGWAPTVDLKEMYQRMMDSWAEQDK